MAQKAPPPLLTIIRLPTLKTNLLFIIVIQKSKKLTRRFSELATMIRIMPTKTEPPSMYGYHLRRRFC